MLVTILLTYFSTYFCVPVPHPSVALSDKDIHDVASKAKLCHDDLQHLFWELGLESHEIEVAQRLDDTRDFKLQAMKVLKSWKSKCGGEATRKAVISALQECDLKEAKEILEQK